MSALWGLIGGDMLLPVIGMIVVFIAGMFGYSKGRRSGENKVLGKTAKRESEGRDAVRKEQSETDGVSSSDLADRLRGRGGD